MVQCCSTQKSVRKAFLLIRLSDYFATHNSIIKPIYSEIKKMHAYLYLFDSQFVILYLCAWVLNHFFLCQVRIAEYNNVRGQLNAINRKQSGRYTLVEICF